jgi:hypothetical protein
MTRCWFIRISFNRSTEEALAEVQELGPALQFLAHQPSDVHRAVEHIRQRNRENPKAMRLSLLPSPVTVSAFTSNDHYPWDNRRVPSVIEPVHLAP